MLNSCCPFRLGDKNGGVGMTNTNITEARITGKKVQKSLPDWRKRRLFISGPWIELSSTIVRSWGKLMPPRNCQVGFREFGPISWASGVRGKLAGHRQNVSFCSELRK